MDQKPQRVPPSPGVITRQIRGFRMVLALMGDRRIPLRYKLLPIGAFFWVIFPDLIPGPLDDLGVAFLAPQFFIDLCRDNCPSVYEKHYDRLFPEEVEKEEEEGQNAS